jgi:hypothetical protein
LGGSSANGTQTIYNGGTLPDYHVRVGKYTGETFGFHLGSKEHQAYRAAELAAWDRLYGADWRHYQAYEAQEALASGSLTDGQIRGYIGRFDPGLDTVPALVVSMPELASGGLGGQAFKYGSSKLVKWGITSQAGIKRYGTIGGLATDATLSLIPGSFLPESTVWTTVPPETTITNPVSSAGNTHLPIKPKGVVDAARRIF